MTDVFDVAVVGGGPGGSVCASRLAKRGARVVVFEKEKFPRFHLGESLLPRSLEILDAIGVLPEVAATFLPKYGARFHDDFLGKKDRFSFEDAWKADIVNAFQVPRDAFDAMLLRHAAACGAEVREEVAVRRLVEGGVETDAGVVKAKLVVDASGRDALTAHTARTTEKIPRLDQTAIYAHFEGVPRQSGKLEGDIDIVLFRQSESERPSWFWIIPFKDGRTSVGAVVSREWIAARDARDPAALFAAAVEAAPTAKSMLANARMLWPAPRATADFSYRVREYHGPGWIAVGDAAGFIDPLFSTGAHIAMSGAFRAADAIIDGTSIEAWAADLRRASETFISAVQAFYAGPLVAHLFADDKRTALRRSITSLLAGDVWTDSIWIRDTRLRLAEMAR